MGVGRSPLRRAGRRLRQGHALDQGSGGSPCVFWQRQKPQLGGLPEVRGKRQNNLLGNSENDPLKALKNSDLYPLKTIVLLLFISSVRASLSMNWGDIVDESERIEPAVSKQGETLYVAGITARLCSDIDRYRVPSQDWGYPAFFRKSIQQTISRQSRNGGNGDTQQLSETRKKKGRCKGNESKQC